MKKIAAYGIYRAKYRFLHYYDHQWKRLARSKIRVKNGLGKVDPAEFLLLLSYAQIVRKLIKSFLKPFIS